MSEAIKIIIATTLTEESMAILKDESRVEVIEITPKTLNIRDALPDAHALVIREDVRVDASLLEAAPLLKLIASMSTGLNNIDMQAATARGILVMNTPGISAIAVGEHTLTLMLALSRRLTASHNSIREGYWLLDRSRQMGTQLFGKTIGLIGMGRVGRIVAQRCLAFNMTVLAYDPYIGEDHLPDDRIQLVGLKKLLKRSDYVSIHVPPTRETQGMINSDIIEGMKEGARLINTAHGSIIDEQIVAEALKSGHLGGVAVDVFSEEPPFSSPLVGLDGVIHTPHIGDNTIEATQDLSLNVVQQVLDAMLDVDYRNVVNMPILPDTSYETIRPVIDLAVGIGHVHHTLAQTPIRRVAVEVRGQDMSGMIKPATVGILMGLLKPVLGDSVSAVNAPLLAHERGLQVTQAKDLTIGDYSNAIVCQVVLENGEEITITGTLLDHSEPHIVQINDYRMNFIPQGDLLIMGSVDKPGIIGQVGTLLANNEVNIASWHTGRANPGGNTLTVLTLDEPMPDHIFDSLMNLEFVRHAHQVQI